MGSPTAPVVGRAAAFIAECHRFLGTYRLGMTALVYAGVTYGLLVTAYSFVNIPYGSLGCSMTQAPRERARLSASRTLMAICTFSSSAMTLGSLMGSTKGAELQISLNRYTLAMP